MKVVEIKTHVRKSALDVPFAFSQGCVHQRCATLVEVLTDEGISGWGEAFRRQLVAEPIERHDGMVTIPAGPGLGIEINRDVVARYAH